MPTAANRQPALAVYTPGNGGYAPFGVKLFTVDGLQISAITGFVSAHTFASFGLSNADSVTGSVRWGVRWRESTPIEVRA